MIQDNFEHARLAAKGKRYTLEAPNGVCFSIANVGKKLDALLQNNSHKRDRRRALLTLANKRGLIAANEDGIPIRRKNSRMHLGDHFLRPKDTSGGEKIGILMEMLIQELIIIFPNLLPEGWHLQMALPDEDKNLKVDFYLQFGPFHLPIQFTTNIPETVDKCGALEKGSRGIFPILSALAVSDCGLKSTDFEREGMESDEILLSEILRIKKPETYNKFLETVHIALKELFKGLENIYKTAATTYSEGGENWQVCLKKPDSSSSSAKH